MRAEFAKYLKYYETLSEASVEELRALAVPELHFVDPFNDERNVEHVIEIFRKMFRRLREPRFKILDAAESGDLLYARWLFEFKVPVIGFGKTWQVTGVSVLALDERGLIKEHLDYWDSATQIYMKLPLVGLLIRGLRKVFA